MTKKSITFFNSKGRLTQVDYANNAVSSGNPIIGLKSSNGVTVITKCDPNIEFGEKTVNPKIFIICRNIGITGSGLQTDLRVLVKKARKLARNFQNNFGEIISVKQLVENLSNFIQEFTHSGGVRPFGNSILIIGFDRLGPNLFQINPSGSFYKIHSSGIGKNSNSAIEFLKKRWRKDLEISESVKLGLMAIQETLDSPISESEIHIGIIESACNFYILSQKQIQEIIKTLT